MGRRDDPGEKAITLAAYKVGCAPGLPIDTEDLLQVGRMAVWQEQEKIDRAHPNWPGLVYRIAWSAMVDEVRRFTGKPGTAKNNARFVSLDEPRPDWFGATAAKHGDNQPAHDGSPEDHCEARSSYAHMMQRLSQRQRNVVAMAHRGDSFVEIGEAMGYGSGGYAGSVCKFAFLLMTNPAQAPRRAM